MIPLRPMVSRLALDQVIGVRIPEWEYLVVEDVEMDKIQQIEHCFTYHAPRPGQPERYALIRAAAKELAFLIVRNSGESREQSIALTTLEEVVFWTNAAIAREL